MAKKSNCKTPQQIWENISSHIVQSVESLFFALGVIVGRHPKRTIFLSLVFVLLSCTGLLRFHIEKNPMKLWIPPESDFFQDTNWYIEKFGSGIRFQKVLITADNVLENHVLAAISNITAAVEHISIPYNNSDYTLDDLCLKVPVVNMLGFSPNSPAVNTNSNDSSQAKSNDDYYDLSLWLDYKFYCNFLDGFTKTCYKENILDLWSNKQDVINQLTKYDIINNVTSVKVNPVSGHPLNFMTLLGGVKHDQSGNVIAASSVVLTWYTYVNMTAVDLNEVGNLVGTEDWVSIPLAKWESSFLNLMKDLSEISEGYKIYYESGRSFGDISGQAMFGELDKLFMGIFLMFFYIQLVLSRCNWLEIRLTLGSVGLLCVGLAYITAIGWCSAVGVSFGPVHSSLPFLLMGLGIDDMFVMKACWDQLTPEEMKKSLPFKVGLMLKHAGVSIVITSFTDIVALLIGAITILPSLKSFCIYAAAGVFFVFCYSVTFYVAVFTLDIRRIEDNRNGIFFCYKHKNPIKLAANETVFQKMFSEFYKKVVFTVPGKALVIIFTVVMTGFSINSILRLEQRFDPQWFIPDGTYYKDFLNNYQQYYPDDGNKGMIFLGEMDYHQEYIKLYDLTQRLENETYVRNLNSWVNVFREYVLRNFNTDLLNSTSVDDETFNSYLSRFLFSPVGGRYQVNFQFEKPLKCGDTLSNVTGSTIQFEFTPFSGPSTYIPAMNAIKDVVKSADIESGDGYRSVWSKAFANWVTDEIISVEVERNIELALLCVMVCTVIMITNLQMCFWIFFCVLLTIVNVLGWMQRWGMTVDIVCCIGLELAIGLCVDYAAHVGHTFLTIHEGTNQERALKTVTSMGTAVLFGGGSAFLSLSVLSLSKAYTFQSFFKIFFLVIVFGLFHGLMFLPVVLSLIGPDGYKPKIEKESQLETVELNGKNKDIEKYENEKFCDDN